MSGTNPLGSMQAPASDPTGGNPLAQAPQTPAGPPQAPAGPGWPQELADPANWSKHLKNGRENLAIIGKLAGKKDVTRKDVIKGISDSVGKGHTTIDQAMEILSSLPDNQAQLKDWLQDRTAKLVDGLIGVTAMQKMGNAIHQAHQMTIQQMQAAGRQPNMTPPPGAIPPDEEAPQ